MPRDLTEPTFCGALVSVICTFFLISLTIYEVQGFMAVNSHAELIVDLTHRDDFVPVNLDITFPKLPCDVLSLDVQDILGTHKTDVMGELYKHRLDANGKIVSTESALDKQAWRGAIMERVKTEFDAKQGCNMKGFFKVYRVPGSFHVSTHAFGDIVMMLKS